MYFAMPFVHVRLKSVATQFRGREIIRRIIVFINIQTRRFQDSIETV